MLVFNFLIFATPLLAMAHSPLAGPLYTGFAATCHQLDSRSLCVYGGGPHEFFHIDSCTPVESTLVLGRHQVIFNGNSMGYKIPVCSRDIAIYLAMLIGIMLYPFLYKLDSQHMPNKWILVAAAIPIGLDGGIQLLSDVGLIPFTYESTNTIRLLTGAVVGIVIPFYLIPVLNIIYHSLAFDKKNVNQGGSGQNSAPKRGKAHSEPKKKR